MSELDAMRVGTPIVAVVESGGAARALYLAIELKLLRPAGEGDTLGTSLCRRHSRP